MNGGFPLNWIERLRCPANGSRLVPVSGLEADGGIRTGLLDAGRNCYPVIEGIPRLILDRVNDALVQLLKNGRVSEARDLAMSWPSKSLGNRIARKLSSTLLESGGGTLAAARLAARLSTGRALRRDWESFEALVDALTAGYVRDWLLYRFSARTFLPLRALVNLLGNSDLVLEIGGGAGHATYAVAGRVRASSIVTIDEVFSHLFVSGTVMTPGTLRICADVNAPLPLDGVNFDAIVMSDTFHFVRAQQLLAQESMRLLAEDGVIILSQLHNRAFPEEFMGNAQSPEGYRQLFADIDARVFRNADLVACITGGADALDLTGATDEPALAACKELSLVASRDSKVFAHHKAVHDAANLQLNPLLKIEGGRFRLIDTVSPLVMEFLTMPDIDGLDASDIERVRTGNHSNAVTREYMRRLILLDMPRNYLSGERA